VSAATDLPAVAVLGQGSIGRRHAGLLRELGCRVTTWDTHGGSAVGEQEAVESSGAVVIASPTNVHLEQARRALEAGRHVLVEKPLATTTEGVEDLVELAESRGLLLAVGMNLRFHPGPARVKELVATGAVGTPRTAHFTFGWHLPDWRPGTDYRDAYSARAELGGGILLDAIHELDYAVWILGEVAEVSARLGHVSDLEVDVEDVALVQLRFASGALASVDLDYLDRAYRRGCRVAGSEASAEWDCSDGHVRLLRPGHAPERWDAPCEFDSTYRTEIDCFVGAVREGRTSLDGLPLVDGREALAVLEIAGAARRSAESGQSVRIGEAV
jgi:predicted dehydrogenase